jgi:secretion/DNA translocation related CpaE-like protein
MSARTSVRTGPRLPLVVTADPDLLDDLLRLAAAGGTELDVAPDPAAARSRIPAAPLVVIGADQAAACLRARVPRRPGTVLAGRSPEIETAWKLAAGLGAEHIIELPTAESWLVDRFANGAGPPPGRILAVIGGRGGAGASILAGALAVTAASGGHRTLLVDADPVGGGLDLVLGWEGVDGLRWPGLAATGGRVNPPALLKALPHRGDLVLLSFARDEVGPVPAEAMAATLDAGRRGRDVIITDLPRQLDDAAALALASADQAIMIVPAELRATAAASRIAAVVRLHCENLAVVVRGPAPGKLRANEVARSIGLPLAGSLRPEAAVCRALEKGDAPAADGRGPLAELSKRLIKQLTLEGVAA